MMLKRGLRSWPHAECESEFLLSGVVSGENEYSALHPPHECFLPEDRKSRGCRGDLVHVLQLLLCSSDSARDAGNGIRGVSDHVWSTEELCGLLPGEVSTTRQIDKNLVSQAPGK